MGDFLFFLFCFLLGLICVKLKLYALRMTNIGACVECKYIPAPHQDVDLEMSFIPRPVLSACLFESVKYVLVTLHGDSHTVR